MNKFLKGVLIVSLFVNLVLGAYALRTSHGDANHDGKVNIYDLSIVTKSWSK